jgi:serine/threonine protein kinase
VSSFAACFLTNQRVAVSCSTVFHFQYRKEVETYKARAQQSGNNEPTLQQYTYADLKTATADFSKANKIGEGGFGCVYKGSLHSTPVAIKVLNSDGVQGPEQFEKEVQVLTKIHHPHILGLIGACTERSCLVYELMEAGSLELILGDRQVGSY